MPFPRPRFGIPEGACPFPSPDSYIKNNVFLCQFSFCLKGLPFPRPRFGIPEGAYAFQGPVSYLKNNVCSGQFSFCLGGWPFPKPRFGFPEGACPFSMPSVLPKKQYLFCGKFGLFWFPVPRLCLSERKARLPEEGFHFSSPDSYLETNVFLCQFGNCAFAAYNLQSWQAGLSVVQAQTSVWAAIA